MPAMEALLQRCLPPLKRWAHGRLPAAARGRLDTGDLVQEAALHAIANLETFEPRHVGAMQAYLRQSVVNRICDEVRRICRQPPPLELPDDHPSDRTSPEEDAIRAEEYDHYREAVLRLTPKDRALIVARIEMQWSLAEIAHRYKMPSVDAARMAVNRAVKRLSTDFAARRK
jgi:RNA polymerase sigma-70 factor (ECF subfamily)